jgi:hypothetical protein
VKGEDSRVRSRKRRPQVRRAGLVAAAMAGLALPIAACSGGSGSGSGRLSGAGDTAYQKAVGFAQCMRSHGEPGFPDPDSHGVFTFHGNPFAGAAYKACRHQLPDGGQATVAQQQKALGQALKFAACVRSHGLPNFPDPTVRGDAILLGGPGLIHSPQFRSAQRACGKFSVGVPGP